MGRVAHHVGIHICNRGDDTMRLVDIDTGKIMNSEAEILEKLDRIIKLLELIAKNTTVNTVDPKYVIYDR
jgi:hypothetical protein